MQMIGVGVCVRLTSMVACTVTHSFPFRGIQSMYNTCTRYVSMVGFAAWLDDNDAVVILCSAINGFVTWPFAGALGLPAAADIVLRKGRVGSTVKWCIYAVILVGVPTLAFDSWMYVAIERYPVFAP